jgi:hypothetical protein
MTNIKTLHETPNILSYFAPTTSFSPTFATSLSPFHNAITKSLFPNLTSIPQQKNSSLSQ